MILQPPVKSDSEALGSRAHLRDGPSTVRAWYREPWPWLLMAGPAAVIIAGVVTTVLAVRSFDGLSAEDYYKQGLAVNKVLARTHMAVALGMSATLQWSANDAGRVQVNLASEHPDQPAALKLMLNHPTRAGLDRSVRLPRLAAGLYATSMDSPAAGRWTAIIEDDAGRWRIRADLVWPPERAVVLEPAQ